MEWLKQQHRALWRFYREEFGESLLITAAAFLVICLLAFGVGLFFKSLPDTIISYFQEMIQLEGLIDEDGGINLLALFGNNVRASAVSILYGFIPFLYLTALALGTNALILGVFAAYYVNNGVSLLVYLAGILPHGIFELTALMLAFAGGFLLCRQITQYVRSNTKGMMKPLKEKNPGMNIVAIDYDAGATVVNQENRLKLMLANARENQEAQKSQSA